VKSMTGFGFGEHRDEKRHVVMTMKSYNNRFLDLFVYMPPSLAVLEPAVRAYAQALRELAREAGIRERLRLSHLLKLEGVIRSETESDPQESWPALEALLEATFQDFDQERAREGQATLEDLLSILAGIEEGVTRIEALAPVMQEKPRTDLRARFREVLGDGLEEGRLLAETAVLLARSDFHEELMRVRAHLESFRTTAGSSGAVGKKLDFLCQELGREVNTIGAKNALLEVDALVVALKDGLEKIREQVRNVE
jgi:uncharacterized protein (TIGR00255 family)